MRVGYLFDPDAGSHAFERQEAALWRVTLARIERPELALIAVINDVQFDFSFEPSDISTLWINAERPELGY